LVDEEVVELAGFFWWGGGVEGGALAASYVAVEGELGDGEDAAADILQAEVHFAVLIFEDAEARDFFCEVGGVGLGVVVGDAEQDQQSGADLAGDFAVDCDLSAADALDDRSHGLG